MTKKIMLILMASMLVLAVGCKEKTDKGGTNSPETKTNEGIETPVAEATGKYKAPTKENVAALLKEDGFTEITEGLNENEFMFEHVNGEEKTTLRFSTHKDKSYAALVDEIKEVYIESDAGLFHTETRTDDNGFYYSAPLFAEEDIYKADIVVDGTHIVAEGNYDLIQPILKALNLPSEEISLDMGSVETSDTQEPLDEVIETPIESPIEEVKN